MDSIAHPFEFSATHRYYRKGERQVSGYHAGRASLPRRSTRSERLGSFFIMLRPFSVHRERRIIAIGNKRLLVFLLADSTQLQLPTRAAIVKEDNQ
jgi:hypothetical protein